MGRILEGVLRILTAIGDDAGQDVRSQRDPGMRARSRAGYTRTDGPTGSSGPLSAEGRLPQSDGVTRSAIEENTYHRSDGPLSSSGPLGQDGPSSRS